MFLTRAGLALEGHSNVINLCTYLLVWIFL